MKANLRPYFYKSSNSLFLPLFDNLVFWLCITLVQGGFCLESKSPISDQALFSQILQRNVCFIFSIYHGIFSKFLEGR
jgi:hypothetical protein